MKLKHRRKEKLMTKIKRKNKAIVIIVSITTVMSIFLSCFSLYANKSRNESPEALGCEVILDTIKLFKQNRTEEKCIEKLEDSRIVNEDYTVPNHYINTFNLDVYEIDDFQVCVFNADAESGEYIFYLHGGAFVYQPLYYHYNFLDNLSKELDCTIIMPVYPKAPNYTYEKTISMVTDTYLDLLTEVESENITIMGDSAGASMSISLCEYFDVMDIQQPNQIIVFSPFMDAALDNPEIADYEDSDALLIPMLTRVKFVAYAGSEEELDNYLVSPMYGDYTNIAPLTIFMGSQEIFLPDVEDFYESATEQNLDVNLYVYENMLHVFPLYPIPESREVRLLIKDMILK
jgi:acetyl esterase/lipase